MSTAGSKAPPACVPLMVVGRYAIYDEIAAGGMATVHLGRLIGPVGFSRTVAIKRLHANLAKDPEFTAMFLDEARLAARIRHPNVVATLDVVAMNRELFLVMDYVHGASMAKLLRIAEDRQERIPLGVVANIVSGMLQGLHAAHEARSDHGEPLGIVHRDVSPQNVLVGVDGVPRLVDFGVAKAMGRVATTRGAQLKGKVCYMAPEQVLGGNVTRRSDVWGAGVVLWQVLAGRKLFNAANDGENLYQIIEPRIEPPSKYNPEVPKELDAIVLRALSKEAADRFATTRDMAIAFEKAVPMLTQREVAEWVDRVASPELASVATRVAEIESVSMTLDRSALGLPSPDDDTDLASLQNAARASLPEPQERSVIISVPPPRRRVNTWAIASVGALIVIGIVAALVWRSSSPSNPSAALSASSTATPILTTSASATVAVQPTDSSPPAVTSSTPSASTPAAKKTPPAQKNTKPGGLYVRE